MMNFFYVFFFFTIILTLNQPLVIDMMYLLEILQTFFKAILYGNKLMYLKSMKTYKKFLLQYCWCWQIFDNQNTKNI